MKNKIISEYHSDIKWDIDGMSMLELYEQVKIWADEYGNEAKIDLYREYSEDEWNIRIISERLETDEEAKIRQEAALAIFLRGKKVQEEQDLRTYKALQIKLGIK